MLVQMRKEIQNCSIHGYWTRAKNFIHCSSVTWGFIYQSMFFRKICKDQWELCLIWFLRLCTWCGQSFCKRILIIKSFCYCSLLIKHTLNHGKQQMYIFYWHSSSSSEYSKKILEFARNSFFMSFYLTTNCISHWNVRQTTFREEILVLYMIRTKS